MVDEVSGTPVRRNSVLEYLQQRIWGVREVDGTSCFTQGQTMWNAAGWIGSWLYRPREVWAVMRRFSFLIVNSNVTNVDLTLGMTSGKGMTVVYGARLRRTGACFTRKNVTSMAGLLMSGFSGRVRSAVVTNS